MKVAIQQVGGDVERVIAVQGSLKFPCSFKDNPVLTYQPPDPAMADISPIFPHFFCHSWPAIVTEAQARLFLDLGQITMSVCGLRLAGRLRKARNPRRQKFIT
jgi:hypothetical protein